MKPNSHSSQPPQVNWSAWGGLAAAALVPLAQASPPPRLFALAALFFGGIFFLYALKYYFSIAVILIANGSGNGNGNGNGHHNGLRNGNGNGHNGLRKRNGNGHNGLRKRNGNGNGHGLKRNGGDTDKLPYKPFISIHLPLYNETTVVDRLLKSVTSLKYEDYEIIVADDSNDETSKILDQRWANHPRVKISRRKDRRGFKGGALQKALEITDPRAEFITVFDADFIPPPDILQQFLAYFYGINGNGNGNGNGHDKDKPPRLVDDRLAVVQGYQWHILNASQNWITKGIRTEFSGSYVVERSSQELLGAMKMISGSVFMIRSDVLRQHGWGTSITEDWELTLRLYLSGYKVLYTPFVQAPSECVATFRDLARQRIRWAEGHTFNVKKYFLRVLTSPNIETREKLEFVYYVPYYLQAVFFILGTACWFISEFIFQYRLPMLPASLGWALVFTNALALVMMNLTGLFMERGVKHNWSGLLSFILLTFLLVPFQAYASLKGLIEPHEGGWHRTKKTGVITDIVDKLGLGKRMKRLLPKQKKKKSREINVGKRLGQPVAQLVRQLPQPIQANLIRSGLALQSGMEKWVSPPAARLGGLFPRSLRAGARRLSLGFQITIGLAIAIGLLSIRAANVEVVSAAPDVFYLHANVLDDGEDMSIVEGSAGSSMSFDTVGQTARWYSALTYPSGGGDATLNSGPYTFKMYFEQFPGTLWWDVDYQCRDEISVDTAVSVGVDAGYSVSLTFDHAALVAAGKAEASGDDLRVVRRVGSTFTELDRILDPFSSWDDANTKIWFSLVDPIVADDSDDSYSLYYCNSLPLSPPANLENVFEIVDEFEDFVITSDLSQSTSGAALIYEVPGDGIIEGTVLGSEDTADAGILVTTLPISDRQIAIRNIIKLEGGVGESTLFGVVEDTSRPTVADSTTEDARRRIMVTHNAGNDSVFLYYLNTVGTQIFWNGSSWISGSPLYDFWTLDVFHSIEFYSDGTDWWFELRDVSGTLLEQTASVPWSDVEDGGGDFWYYWGEPYTDQNWATFERSQWLDIRDFVDPEPLPWLGGEETQSSVDIAVSVYHTDAAGNNPQPIRSGLATIDISSTNPVTIDLGNGGTQNFTSDDPQRLRVEIEILSTTNGGNFTLAYDGFCSSDLCSHLETPVLVVPEYAIAFVAIAVLIPAAMAAMHRRRRAPSIRARKSRSPWRLIRKQPR